MSDNSAQYCFQSLPVEQQNWRIYSTLGPSVLADAAVLHGSNYPINGTYPRNGTADALPSYGATIGATSGITIYHNSGQWIIAMQGGSNYYTSNDNVTEPWLATNWTTADFNDASLPISVTQASSMLVTTQPISGGGGGGGDASAANQTTQIAQVTAVTANAGSNASKAIAVQGIAGGVAQPVSGTFWQATQPISAASLPLPTGAATSALQTTGNTSLATIATNSGTQATAANQTTGNTSLSTIATNSGTQATAANQTTGNTSLGTIATNTTTLVGKQTFPVNATTLVAVGTANTDLTLTLAAAGAGISNIIDGIEFSYSGVPTTGRMTITDGTAGVVFDTDITGGGAGPLWGLYRKSTANATLAVKLFAGGAGIIGKLNILKFRTE